MTARFAAERGPAAPFLDGVRLAAFVAGGPVTAPVAAEPTRATYLANTPVR